MLKAKTFLLSVAITLFLALGSQEIQAEEPFLFANKLNDPFSLEDSFMLAQAEEGSSTEEGSSKIEDEFLKLGTAEGIGGKDWMKFDRWQIKYQIEQFIPPLLQSALVGDSFVLPPNARRVEVSSRFATLDGEDDFFFRSNENTDEFKNFTVKRTFLDLDLLYGFDLNRKYLHSFTLRVNIPYLISRTNGFIHPNGLGLFDIINEGSSQRLGDIEIFLKKKLIDQATFPIGLAIAGSIAIPTGENDEQFTNGGMIQVRRPDVPVMPPLNTPIPVSFLMSLPRIPSPFPLSKDNVFNRFTDDGRLPAGLQPGRGTLSSLVGIFATRQFNPGNFALLRGLPGRSAFHAGFLYNFNFEEDGVDPGDQMTYFLSFIKPVYKDFLSIELAHVGFYQFEDRYTGTFIQPFSFNNNGTPSVIFREIRRPSFSWGLTGLIAPSIIYSPDPQWRLTITPLIRVIDPNKGPAPGFVLRFGVTFTF